VSFSRDGTRAFTGSKESDGESFGIRERGRKCLPCSRPRLQEVTVVAMSPDNRRLLSAARDGSAILWQSEAWTSPSDAQPPR
jgi:WD40 repeat protein